MIKITDKSQCCGCNGCVQRCPKVCIAMVEDEEGFLYPQVDTAKCIECGLCEKVCPVLNQKEEKEPIAVFATQHKDKSVRLKSSSGGIFTLIAEKVIEHGGVVFGARWDEKMTLVHAYTDTIDGLEPFRRSKYVQSYIGDAYKQTEDFLKHGRFVLFTGVACQIAGLKRFLQKEYDNLLTVDVLCHGVPSPGIWKKYVAELGGKHIVTDFNFRNKKSGWKNYSVSYKLDNGKEICYNARLDEYWRGFLSNYMTRPSCYFCPVKSGKCGSDLTLGDLWAVNHLQDVKDDDTGLSLIAVNTHLGERQLKSLGLELHTLPQEFMRKHVAGFYSPTPKCPQRADFWTDYSTRGLAAMADMNTRCMCSSISQTKYLLFKTKVVKILHGLFH